MGRRKPTPLRPLVELEPIRETARRLVWAVQGEAAERALAPDSHERAVAELARVRGRPAAHDGMASGAGRGARLQMADGTTRIDFASGGGLHPFGHADEDLLSTAVAAAAGDVVLQDAVTPRPETLRLSRLLRKAVGARLRHVVLTSTSDEANEAALKLVFHRRAPADHVIVFEGAHHGHSAALQELSDRPDGREGQPVRGNVLRVPYFDPTDPETTERSLAALEGHLQRHPERIAGMAFELVQSEAGFESAPREFFAALMERCREAEIAVWVDETRTVARTGELFAFQTLDLEDSVDVVSAGGALQAGAVLFASRYAPPAGLLPNTAAGSTVALAVGARVIERLQDDAYLGPEGRIAVLGRRIERRFESLRKRMSRAVTPRSGLGAMLAFQVLDGSAATTEAVIKAAYEAGMILLPTGMDPVRIRLIPPLNATDEELEAAFAILEKSLRQVAEAKGLPC